MLRITHNIRWWIAISLMMLLTIPAHATIISVSGPLSSLGTAAAIIAAPANILDDNVTNTGMQGFDEAQGVVTTSAYVFNVGPDVPGGNGGPGGSIAAGTRVNSHMIFFNTEDEAPSAHFGVRWTFDGVILGVMSDVDGLLEAASTSELGNPLTNYPLPYTNRGIESEDCGCGGPFPLDGFTFIDPYTLSVGMSVREPGDWVRVVTTAVPEPASLALMGLGLVGLGFATRQKNKQGK